MKKNATTLVELIVVISITALLASTILVSYTLLDRRNLEVSARTLMSDLSWAREAAMTRHYQYIAVFNTSAREYTIYEDVSNFNVTDSGEERLTTRLKIDSLNITNASSGIPLTSPVEFKYILPYGEIVAAGATEEINVDMSRAGRTRRVKVFPVSAYLRMD
jgi:Tfp pilus assembly protein PilE